MTPRSYFLPVLLAFTLAVASCGIDTGALGDGSIDADPPGLDRPDDDGVSGPGDGGGGDAPIEWARLSPRFDLVGSRLGYVNEVVVDPDDDRVLLVRFFGGVEECYGAYATVVSQAIDEIVVELQVGGVPFGDGSPVCIDIALAQEIALVLDEPAGDAVLRAAQPDAAAAFVGLTTADAVAAAETEGRAWRIASEDGESFALTMDYVPTRVNFEVEAGIVADAWMG
jgi:hypothetical protein